MVLDIAGHRAPHISRVPALLAVTLVAAGFVAIGSPPRQSGVNGPAPGRTTRESEQR
jgi:hypothetical protein